MIKRSKNPYFNKEKNISWEQGFKNLPLSSQSPLAKKCYLEGKEKTAQNQALIPDGIYCYTYITNESGKTQYKRCPYWGLKHNNKFKGRVGMCGFLSHNDDSSELHGFGQLHDQCKECQVNNTDDEVID